MKTCKLLILQVQKTRKTHPIAISLRSYYDRALQGTPQRAHRLRRTNAAEVNEKRTPHRTLKTPRQNPFTVRSTLEVSSANIGSRTIWFTNRSTSRSDFTTDRI